MAKIICSRFKPEGPNQTRKHEGKTLKTEETSSNAAVYTTSALKVAVRDLRHSARSALKHDLSPDSVHQLRIPCNKLTNQNAMLALSMSYSLDQEFRIIRRLRRKAATPREYHIFANYLKSLTQDLSSTERETQSWLVERLENKTKKTKVSLETSLENFTQKYPKLFTDLLNSKSGTAESGNIKMSISRFLRPRIIQKINLLLDEMKSVKSVELQTPEELLL